METSQPPPPHPAPPGFRTPVRGHAFAARPADASLAPGTPARLVREPDNPRDPLAVAVWVEAPSPWRIGYLDRAVAARVAPRVDRGAAPPSALLEGWIESPGGWQRPLLAVGTDHGRTTRPCPRRDPMRPDLWGRPPGVTRRTLPASVGR